MNRKVILYIAVSLDNYIARENGDVDWLIGDGSNPNMDNGYEDFYKTIDVVILGKSTYDQVIGWGEYPYKNCESYVYTRKEIKDNEYIKFINEDPRNLISKLKEKPGKDIWIVGGADIVDLFLKQDLIDEFIIATIPTILGSGIPLFKDSNMEIKLSLKESKIFDGIVQNHYIKKY
ncbi:dihydrofolate reductase [Clostridium sp. Sa3CUN1]|uniref:Dihydrofolate reductase n=1 Tax=Clostridium gallinarum TaxID=2762246 RepID=A0ABR8Q5K5_9CLOT|nr:dihydrofolate reductase family protein [Clostridium gallinarum]MBD7915701.1 dihydrofolate reductase [Clostridium gallinarum]